MKSVVADLADGLARVHDYYVFVTFLKTTRVDHKMKFNHSISIPTKFLFMLQFSTATQIIIIIINLTCIALFLKNSIALNSRKDKSKM